MAWTTPRTWSDEELVTAALLKGRANYLCHHRLAVARTEGRLESRQQISYLETIRDLYKILSTYF